MAKYHWCMGITLDGNFCEQTCKRRDNCVYYLEDLFRRFNRDELEEYPLLNEPGRECSYFVPRREEVKKEETDDPFLALMQCV